MIPQKIKTEYSKHDIYMFEQFISGKIGKVDLERDGKRIEKIKLEIAYQKL